MKPPAADVADYLAQVPDERRPYFLKLRETILSNLPDGFSEQLSYGMVGYVVPHTLHPDGYHCNPSLPLPFAGIASQKHFIGLYHMGIYADPELLDWFVNEYPSHSAHKLDMGKSCIRFKQLESIPYALIRRLMGKLTVQDWIALYETQRPRRNRADRR